MEVEVQKAFLKEGDETREDFRDTYPKTFMIFLVGILELSLKEKRESLQILIEALDESDCEDMFGTEGWKHRFNID